MTDGHDVDEGAFVVIARGLLRGELPYRDLIDHKPVGLEVLVAPLLAMGGDSLARLGMAALAASVALPVAGMASAMAGKRAGLYAAVFCVAQPLFIKQPGGLSQSVAAGALEAWAAWIVFKAAQQSAPGRGVLGGVLLGLAFEVKQPGLLVLPGIAAMLIALGLERADRGVVARVGLAVAAGLVAVVMLQVAAVAVAGVLPEYVIYVFRVNGDLGFGLSGLTGTLIVRGILLSFAGPLLIAAFVTWRSQYRPGLALLVGWSGAHLVFFFAYPVYYQHYGWFLFPPLAVIGGAGLAKLAVRERKVAGAIAVAAALAWLLGMAALDDQSPRSLAQEEEIAHSLAKATLPGDRVMILGNPIIYVLADRPVFSPYFYWSWRYLESPVSATYLDEYKSALRGRQPAAVVMAETYRSDIVDRAPDLLDLIAANYVEARRFEDPYLGKTVLYVRAGR